MSFAFKTGLLQYLKKKRYTRSLLLKKTVVDHDALVIEIRITRETFDVRISIYKNKEDLLRR